MSILIVGNVINDVYLNLDSRTEKFETDKNHTKWLDLSFNASEHHFFSRESSLGGSAITLEILQKLNLEAAISNSTLNFASEETALNPASSHRYILVSDENVSYFAPTTFKKSTFIPPDISVDYIYLDRSAEIDSENSQKISTYLEKFPNTKLVLYVRNFENPHLNRLLTSADLIFTENNRDNSEKPYAPASSDLDPKKLIYLSENHLSYLDISESISPERIDVLTHLSLYSIASATILGSFILGYSVEDSLKMARANIENSRLNSTLDLDELKTISENISSDSNLKLIAENLVLYPKGILAADESGGSIHKKFDQLSIPDTYENRRDYRNIFFTTSDLEKYVNGVILFDETARQFADNGQNFVDFLTSKRIIPGIKVDQGLEKFENSEETYTKGLDGLAKRLKEYYLMGLRFAKWRAAFEIRLDEKHEIITPSDHAILENCKILAEYAKNCQSAGLVPIVEPEVVYDGYYDIDQSAFVTGKILDCLFKELNNFKVDLKACILKVNMVLAGKKFETQSTPEQIGIKTAEVLKNCVPSSLAGIVFLSGGQTPEQATANLAEITKNGPFPWPVTFSFARALQDPALYAWGGNNDNADKAREAFKERLVANQKALEK
ncbi:fructose-bisphosphate aldolase class I [Candidatus Saccharibacteria bacterium]|nr:fructose-bisphosphate aldolase class I [Candidatus Saccharibacteria bacterium]